MLVGPTLFRSRDDAFEALHILSACTFVLFWLTVHGQCLGRFSG